MTLTWHSYSIICKFAPQTTWLWRMHRAPKITFHMRAIWKCTFGGALVTVVTVVSLVSVAASVTVLPAVPMVSLYL